MSRTYSIGDLAREFGVTARTLRHYEQEGLISPERRGQTRLYSARDRTRIKIILRSRRVGFSLAEIAETLDMYGQGEGEQAQLLHARRKFAERVATLERHKIDIEEMLADLKLSLATIEHRLAELGSQGQPLPRLRPRDKMPEQDRKGEPQ